VGWVTKVPVLSFTEPRISWLVSDTSQEAADPETDLDYIVCSLDALSGVAEALGFRFEALLSAPAPAPTALRDILLQCCQVQRRRRACMFRVPQPPRP
jgi:hypothetical protein